MLNESGDYTDLFIRTVFSEEEGWMNCDLQKVGPFPVDNTFRHLNGSVLLIQRINEPLVTEQQLNAALQMRATYKLIHDRDDARVILVYGKLLLQPKRLPGGVSIMSVTEDVDVDHSQSLTDVQCN